MQGLTNNSSFPNFPASVDVLTNGFRTPMDLADRYGQRLRALITVPVTGSYVFWVVADDAGLLFLSTDESPVNKRQIAWVTNSPCRPAGTFTAVNSPRTLFSKRGAAITSKRGTAHTGQRPGQCRMEIARRLFGATDPH